MQNRLSKKQKANIQGRKLTKRPFTDKGIKAARDLERVLGEKVSVTIGSPENGGITHYYSTALPPLTISIKNAKREILVEVSSIDNDNHDLLHHLFRRSVEE